MRASLFKASLIALAVTLAGCAEAPNDADQAFASSRDDVADAALSFEIASAPPMPPAVSTRSAGLARFGKSFDQAFYDASAQRHAANIAALRQAFIDLGPEVDPEEAARAAYVVYTYVDQLVVEYEITGSALSHNTQVNFGTKPRGLCWHWAHDLDARLRLEKFQTLQIHRAIANYNNILLEHSGTILSRRGDAMQDGYILDPWRYAGKLHWQIVRDDKRYNWTEREKVFAWKREQEARKTASSNSNVTRRTGVVARSDI